MVDNRRLAQLLHEHLRESSGMPHGEYDRECQRLGYRPGTARLAERAGVSQRTLGRVMSCEQPQVTLWMADRLAHAAQISPLVIRKITSGPEFQDWEIGYAEDCLTLSSLEDLQQRLASAEPTGAGTGW